MVNITLLEKLKNIDKTAIKKLPEGTAKSIEEFWHNLIVPYLPKRDIVLRWHDLLVKYINSEHPTFAIRGYNSFPKERYGDLRRGFLTDTKDFSFFYTDNFFASYFQKLSLDGFVPTFDEFVSSFKNRQFPSRFGKITHEEKELLAIQQGKDTKINSAGFKIAHIIPVGKNYFFNHTNMGSSYILNNFFPKGERTDWQLVHDQTGNYYKRSMYVDYFAKDLAISIFLRFIHPLNYFLCPKKTCETNNKCKELAEYEPLLAYAHDYNLDMYRDVYMEYLNLIMLPQNKNYSSALFEQHTNIIDITYGTNNQSIALSHKPNLNTNISIKPISNEIDLVHLKMLIEYVSNPYTSFRKLEIEYLGIDRKGFVAKSIINSYGITAANKGELKECSTDSFTDKLLELVKSSLQN